MARRISSLRPRQRIIALTEVEKSFNQMAMSWGVEPYKLEYADSNTTSMLERLDDALLRYNLAERGEIVVAMAGKLDDIIISLSMKLHKVGELAGS
jgi:pyruvate kinase